MLAGQLQRHGSPNIYETAQRYSLLAYTHLQNFEKTPGNSRTCAPKMPIQAFSGLCPMLASAHKLDARSRPLASCKSEKKSTAAGAAAAATQQRTDGVQALNSSKHSSRSSTPCRMLCPSQ
jgi:hypothetical protein